MANIVVNMFAIKCHPYSTERVKSEIAQITNELNTEVSPDGGNRWRPEDGEPLTFLSWWGPDHELHDRLTHRLAAVDTSVIVSNWYWEEFYNFAGVRIARVVGTSVQAVNMEDVPEIEAEHSLVESEDSVIGEELDRAVLIAQERCAKLAEETWAAQFKDEPELIDLRDYTVDHECR